MLTYPDCEACHEDRLKYAELNQSFDTETDEPLNTSLLLQVLLTIHLEPERWNQATFFGKGNCGTTQCIAGWTLALEGYGPDLDGSYAEKAQELLGLSDDEREHLFYHLQTDDLAVLTNTVHTLFTHRGLTRTLTPATTQELTDARTS